MAIDNQSLKNTYKCVQFLYFVKLWNKLQQHCYCLEVM